jgi:MFS transporter, FHS family, glucose/mannose:H+ symporter
VEAALPDSAAARDTESRLLTLAGYYGFLVLGWKALFLPSVIRSVEHAFHQGDAAFGFLYFVSAIAYAAATFGGGVITERIGRRTVLLASVILSILGTLAQAASPGWLWFLVATVPAGCGMGLIDGGINALFLDLYRDARGGALNTVHFFFGLGALLGPACIGLLLTAGMDWRLIGVLTAITYIPLLPVLMRVGMPSGRVQSPTTSSEGAQIDAVERSLIPFIGLALGIGLYVAAEAGVSSWLVRFLSSVSVGTATAVLSAYFVGLSLGRLISRWLADLMDYYVFTLACIALASLALVAAVFSPSLPVAAVLFTLSGMFYGPIYPMIMALGGNIYPHRLAALSGGLATAAVIGSIVYPPAMGVLESHIGLTGGMVGAALLGIPTAGGIILARVTAPNRSVEEG